MFVQIQILKFYCSKFMIISSPHSQPTALSHLLFCIKKDLPGSGQFAGSHRFHIIDIFVNEPSTSCSYCFVANRDNFGCILVELSR